MHRLLIVEDDFDLQALLEDAFRNEQLECRVTALGGQALELVRRERPDLILLDLMLPDLPGTEVCRRLKREPSSAGIPLVILTARSEPADRVAGLELGADDYVTKPFSLRELVLRVRALLRATTAASTAPAGRVRVGPVSLDLPAHRAWVEGLELGLTALEFRILAILLERPGRVQSRAALLAEVERDEEVGERAIDTHVKRLRAKLGASAAWLETVRGVGYRYRDPAPPRDQAEGDR